EVEIDGTPSSASIKPGEYYNFTIIVRNKGTGDDTFEFYVEGTKKDWAKIYNGSTEQYQVFVPAGHTATMTLKISVPLDELMATGINFTLNASSMESLEEIFVTFDVTVDVEQSYEVRLGGVYPIIQIHNEGNGIDSFLIDVEDPIPGWEYKFNGQDPPIIVVVESGSYVTITIDIIPPPDEAQGAYMIKITAISQGDPSVYTNYTLTVTVDQAFGVELESSGPDTRDIDIEGGSTEFKVKVFNRGNGPDDLLLSIDSQYDFWVEMNYDEVSPSQNQYTMVSIWLNISSRQDWEDEGEPDPILIDVIAVCSVADPSEAEGTKDILTLRADVKPIYEFHASVTPSTHQEVEMGSSVTFYFDITNTGTGPQNYRASTMGYDSTNLSAPALSPSGIFPDGQQLQVTVSPRVDAHMGPYIVWIKIVVDEDDAVQFHVNLTVHVKADYGVQLWAQNNETNKETLINTHANYTLIIKNTGNTEDTFFLGAIEPYSQLVSFIPDNVTLAPDQSGDVLCRVFADQAIVEVNNLYGTGIPSWIKVNSKGDNTVSADLSLDTDITASHGLFLRCQDSIKYVEPGNSADFDLYVDNTGTTSSRYNSAVVGFDTSVLGNPTFSPMGTFPLSGSVAPGTSTTLDVSVPVLDVDPTVPAGEYWMVIRISIDGHPSIYEDYNFTVNVKQVYVHTLEAVEDKKGADVNEYVEYTLTLKNTGNNLETFVIRATGYYGGLVTLEMTEVDLAQSESIDFYILVYTDPIIIERDDLYGMDLETSVEVVSKGDPDSYAVEVPIYTTIEHSCDFELTSPQTTKMGKPGDLSLQFTLQVRNIGTTHDSYRFRVTGMDEEIFHVPEPTSIYNLGADSYGTTAVFVTITSEKHLAIAGEYQIEITADSEEDP
ncbi:MAG: hypothetical protein JSW28_04725, partial [Thermoplasmata archaeon]